MHKHNRQTLPSNKPQQEKLPHQNAEAEPKQVARLRRMWGWRDRVLSHTQCASATLVEALTQVIPHVSQPTGKADCAMHQ